MQDSLKILVAGGCHVQGWLVGKKRSFVQVLSDRLNVRGLPHVVEVVPYTTISKVGKSFALKQFKGVDVLVLQLGNHEFSPSLRADIKRVFKRMRKKAGAQDPTVKKYGDPLVVDNPYQTFALTWKFTFGQKVKLFANGLIANSWLNIHKLNMEVDEAFKNVQKASPGIVVVLSPFPTSNKVTNIYREKGGEVLKAHSEKWGFHYLDIMEAFRARFAQQTVTIDEMHLNATSHEFIGVWLSSQLETLLTE